MDISAKTKLLGLFGSPVEHSKSPQMYNYCFNKYNIDYCYMAFETELKDIDDIASAMRNFKMVGANITMPLKNAIVDYMDELTPAARIIGAVNTVINKDGKLYGYNTDGVGFFKNLQGSSVDIKDKKITIMGAGGAGTAIQVQAALYGAKEISIFNRKDNFFKQANKTAKKIEYEVGKSIVNVYDIEDLDIMKREVESSDLFINATSLGMNGKNQEQFFQGIFREDLIVADVVYNPPETLFLKTAKKEGCKKIFNGGGMLLYQGAESFKLFTNRDMPIDEVRKIYFK